jgi:uncharacterized membrane protein
MSRLATATSIIAAFFLLGSAAQADIMVCNDFRAPIHVAFASQNKGGFNAAGWWTVAPKACQAVDFAFKGATLYYTADSDNYQIEKATAQDHWGNVVQLFVTSEDFKLDNADVSRDGAKAEKFSLAEIPPLFGGNPVTITLHFSQGSVTVNVTGRPSRRRSHRS